MAEFLRSGCRVMIVTVAQSTIAGVVNLLVADRADGREGRAGPVGDARSGGCGQAGDFVPDPEAVAHLGVVLGGRQQVATGPEVR